MNSKVGPIAFALALMAVAAECETLKPRQLDRGINADFSGNRIRYVYFRPTARLETEEYIDNQWCRVKAECFLRNELDGSQVVVLKKTYTVDVYNNKNRNRAFLETVVKKTESKDIYTNPAPPPKPPQPKVEDPLSPSVPPEPPVSPATPKP